MAAGTNCAPDSVERFLNLGIRFLYVNYIRTPLEKLPAERMVVAPDCGMKYLSRDVAFRKLKAMVEGAELVRKELKLN